MKRRTVMMNIGVTAIALVAGQAAEASSSIRCEITFEAGMPIPAGQIEVVIEDTAIENGKKQQNLSVQLVSNGKSQTMLFDFPLPSTIKTTPTLQIVAYLERKDGWLLARGSTDFNMHEQNEIELFTAVY